MKLNSNKNYC